MPAYFHHEYSPTTVHSHSLLTTSFLLDFKEPLYPFLLLRLETDAIPLSDEEDDDKIKPLQLFAQIDHRRDAERGVLLDATELKVRQIETIKADVFGAAKVDVYEEVSVGTLSVQPAVKAEA